MLPDVLEVTSYTVEILNYTSIGDNAFRGLNGIQSINIPNSVTSIGNYAFRGLTKIPSIIIPNSVTSIGGNAFENCYLLASITFERTNPPTFGTDVFRNAGINVGGLTIYVPFKSLAAYTTALSSAGITGVTIEANPSTIPNPNTILRIGGKMKVGPNSKVIIGPP